MKDILKPPEVARILGCSPQYGNISGAAYGILGNVFPKRKETRQPMNLIFTGQNLKPISGGV